MVDIKENTRPYRVNGDIVNDRDGYREERYE